MERYAPKAMELAPRDIVARSIMTEVEQGRAFPGDFVHLDLRGLGESRIMERLPGIRAISLDFAGVDPVEDPIPVQPGQHYSMGGLDVDDRCSTTVPGLYAAGECACISVHGANRLGGNSLLEALVFGMMAGRSMVGDLISPSGDRVGVIKSHLEREMDRLERMVAGRSGESVPDIRRELKENMFDHFGVFREQRRMADGYRYLGVLRKRSSDLSIEDKGKIFNQSLMAALELEGMFLMAETVAMGAIYREESRGSHYRTDFPKRDDQRFLAHSIFEWDGGSVRLSHSPVRLGLVPLQERAY
jgi:succinate dehydrogenase / fumarate reductase flavoprotein subunit